jgi:hypothetical protein
MTSDPSTYFHVQNLLTVLSKVGLTRSVEREELPRGVLKPCKRHSATSFLPISLKNIPSLPHCLTPKFSHSHKISSFLLKKYYLLSSLPAFSSPHCFNPSSKALTKLLDTAISENETLPVHQSSQLSALAPSLGSSNPTLTSSKSGLHVQCQKIVAPQTLQNSLQISLELS